MLRNIRGYVNWEMFLIILSFILILGCLYGYVGYEQVKDSGLTCDFGIGFFCWKW